MAPTTPYERSGDVPTSSFRAGGRSSGDELRVYYGAADTTMCLATGRLSEVLDWLNDHADDT